MRRPQPAGRTRDRVWFTADRGVEVAVDIYASGELFDMHVEGEIGEVELKEIPTRGQLLHLLDALAVRG